ncbi:MAG: inorganic phosphate transporter [Candidatus Thiodiazotropha taylori]|nr:inorganic phosphate transporter [Candidatus Thiodiazotropha taylori]MCG8029021.1 inorganic phosphate transporter [Candidatus Thiodiazotropha taylori]MCG8041954.1 inorganic phosphate transporter [Candidatus Thiodiazotropha taylori]MCG8052542.1 inorganic phosphate transporter [Candidatus Thiodiazotropha taylori]MCG8108900.1 inorganic phosphate transporter [Candidatus Thiodiazotropha taylori]
MHYFRGSSLSFYHPLYHLHHLIAVVFLISIAFTSHLFFNGLGGHDLILLTAIICGYMALNIGANDAGNNIGPLVGSAVITLSGAVVLAAIFEFFGAFLAGSEVISTIKHGIVEQQQLGGSREIVLVMISALLASGLWLNIATATGTPVSTTHTIVGGVLGAGITIGGVAVVNWQALGTITISWFLSPLLGSAIAALLLYLIKRNITYQIEMSRATERLVPVFVGLMALTFTTYLLTKGLKSSWRTDLTTALFCGLSVGIGIFLIIKPIIKQHVAILPNTKSAVNRHFNIPLLIAAALLSFAHGSNDVANAIGPVIAIKEALVSDQSIRLTALPTWVLLVGAIGIPLGIVLYGKRMIKTIGNEITEFDQIRAFCVVTSVTITVLLASLLGIPVSSTHTTVGAIFGIGFLRENLKKRYAVSMEILKRQASKKNQQDIDKFIQQFDDSSFYEKGKLLKSLNDRDITSKITEKDRKSLNKLYRKELVKRSTFIRILVAWVITLPVAGLLASLIYTLLDSTNLIAVG